MISHKTKTLSFPQGGIHPKDKKLSMDKSITPFPLPETVSLPVTQHLGRPAEPVVKAGDRVKVGQLIAKATGWISANTHATVSGTIIKLDKIVDISGYRQDTAVIKVEGDEWADGIDLSAEIKREIIATPEEIYKRALDAGIVGLGGATFPSHVKLKIPDGKKADTLCINGAECEPFLTSDYRLMLERGEEMIIGVQLAMKALNLKRALIGIEDNKWDAVQNLKRFIPTQNGIEIFALKTHYPQGGERQLVKALVNREIPPPPYGLPIDVGCIVFNVATMCAIYDAVQKNKPLIERVVTVTGTSLKTTANFSVRFGTPIAQLIDAVGGLPDDTGKILLGGPMMGKSVTTTNVPLSKGISGVLIIPHNEAKRDIVLNCIRCAKCVSVCPLGLEPYLMKQLTEQQLWDKAERERVTSCCECGCCSYVCPSHIPLLDYLKLGKNIVNNIVRSRQKK